MVKLPSKLRLYAASIYIYLKILEYFNHMQMINSHLWHIRIVIISCVTWNIMFCWHWKRKIWKPSGTLLNPHILVSGANSHKHAISNQGCSVIHKVAAVLFKHSDFPPPSFLFCKEIRNIFKKQLYKVWQVFYYDFKHSTDGRITSATLLLWKILLCTPQSLNWISEINC